MLNRNFVILALFLVFSAGQAQQAWAETVTIHGSTTVANSLLLPAEKDIEKRSGQALEIVANGSGNGVMDLVRGKARMAMVSAPLDAVVAKLNSKKPGSVDGAALVGHLVGATRVAFVVHPSNKLRFLTIDQITDVLAGRITNWGELGGPDRPIVIVAEQKGGGARSMVEKSLLKGADLGGTVKVSGGGAATAVAAVAKMPHAIGIAMDAVVDSSVGTLKSDRAVGQPLILVTLGTPSANLNQVIVAAREIGFY